MRKRPTIALLVAQGWSVRNWLLSNFLDELTPHATVLVLSPRPAELEALFARPGVLFEHMATEPLGKVGQLFYRMTQFAHYYRFPTRLNRYVLARATDVNGLWRTRLMGGSMKILARGLLAHLPPRAVAVLEPRMLALAGESNRLEGVLRRHEVDVVFSTLPLITHFEYPALWAARRLGLSSASFITSWDNPFGKGRLPIRFDHYMVWGRAMAEALLAANPELRDASISALGSPQFDFYFDPSWLRPRDRFLKAIGADPNRKLILWAAGSAGLVPTEPALIADFCTRLRASPIAGDPQLYVRPHPHNRASRFDDLRRDFPEVLFPPSDESDPYLTRWIPDPDEVTLLTNLVAHADVQMNVASTMTLDSCLMDRPVVNVMFDLDSGSEAERRYRAYYDFEHYRSVLECGAVRLARSPSELVDQVNVYLKNRDLDAPGRRRLVEHWFGASEGDSAAQAAVCLLALASRERL